MYILVFLFGIVNFYFIFTTLLMLLGFFTEYVQVPLINFCAKTFRLPIHYSVERTLVPCNANIFNIIFNQDYNNQDNNDKNTESSEESDNDTNDEAGEADANDEIDDAAVKESNNEAESTDTEEETTKQVNDDSDVPDLIDENELLFLKKPNSIIIDETLD